MAIRQKINQAQQLVVQGNTVAAEELLLEALKDNPRSIDALHLLSVICIMENNFPPAIDLINQILRVKRSSPVLNNLGMIYLKMGNIDAAEKTLLRAIKFDKNNANAHKNYATTVMALGRNKEAIKHFRLAHKKSSQLKAACIAGEASVKERMGLIDEGFADIKKLIDEGDTSSDTLLIFCQIIIQHSKFIDHIDFAIDNIKQHYNSGKFSKGDLKYYFFRLGSLLEKKKNFEEAFEAFTAAHNHSQNPYDEKSQIASDKKMLKFWEGAEVAVSETGDHKKYNHIFIVGMPRSGSTLINQIIATTPSSTILGECSFFHKALNEISQGEEDTVNSGGRSLSNDEIKKVKNSYNRNAFKGRKPTGLLVDKSLFNHIHIGQILQVFPYAKIIWTRRDPRDVSISCYTTDFAGAFGFQHNLGTLARYFNRTEQRMLFWAKYSPKNIHISKYEDITLSPETNIRELIDFCEIPWVDGYLNFHESKTVAATASYNQVKKPIYTSSIARWRNYELYIGLLLEELIIPGDYQ